MQYVVLDINNNNIGLNVENLKLLEEGLKNLPQNLKTLKLDLCNNYLGRNFGNMRKFGVII